MGIRISNLIGSGKNNLPDREYIFWNLEFLQKYSRSGIQICLAIPAWVSENMYSLYIINA